MMALLRASTAWRLLPAVVAAEAFAIFSRGQPWLGEWNWTTDWVNGATVLTMPLLAACVAYDASALSRAGTRVLVVSAPRGLLGFAWPAWSSWVLFSTVHLAALVCGLSLNLYVGAGSSPSMIGVPVAFSALAAAAAIGQAIGVALPNVVAAPVSGVTLLAVNIIGAGNVIPQFMRVGGATGSLVGLTWDSRVIILDLAVHVGLVFGLTAALARVTWPRVDGRPTYVPLTAGLGVAGVALLLLQGNTWSRLEPTEQPVAFACRQGVAEVCMAKATSRKLTSLSGAVDEQLAVLQAASAAVPSAFRQVVPGQPALPPETAPLLIESEALNAPTTSAEEAAAYVVTPTMCPQLTAERPPPPAYFSARQLLYTWLLASQGELSLSKVTDPAARAWLGLEASEQAAWVSDTYERLTTCELDEISLPFGLHDES
jgi:hypothetical protein